MKGNLMKTYWLAALGIGSLICVGVLPGGDDKDDKEEAGKAPPSEGEKPELKSNSEKASYSIGLNIGKNMRNQGIELELKTFVKGLEHGLSGGKALLTDAESREVMMDFQKEMMAKQAERKKGQAEKNKKEGEAFLAENEKKPGVTTLPSGLQYKVITQGTGEKPKATDTVTTHYRGTLINGTEFDSSLSRGEPAKFQVGGVIKGWTEALQLMPVGSKWQLFIPAALAYAERGAGNDIGPNAVLIFELELISIGEDK
jgi:FKBP-type peptidyl-prolyl cis-trans isomerase